MEQLQVLGIARHWDEEIQQWRNYGEQYVCARDLAERRERHGLVEIAGPVEGLEDTAETPDLEDGVPEEVSETKRPEDIIKEKDGGWYEVEGWDDNPVRGEDSALDAARIVIDRD